MIAGDITQTLSPTTEDSVCLAGWGWRGLLDTPLRACTHSHACTHVHTHTCTRTHTTHARTPHTREHAHMRTHAHTCTLYTHVLTHTCTYTRTHTAHAHTQTRAHTRSGCLNDKCPFSQEAPHWRPLTTLTVKLEFPVDSDVECIFLLEC